jgi:small-conductance mechanosensitive channel
MAPPGTYSVTLSRRVEGVVTDLSGPVSFEVRPLRDGSLEGADPADAAAFWARVEATQRSASAARMALSEHRNRLEAMVVALGRSTADPGDLDTDLEALRQELLDLDLQLNGHRSMRQVGEPRVPSIADRVGRTRSGVRSSTYGPTPNLERNLEIAEAQLQDVVEQLNRIGRDTLPSLANRLQQAGAPWSPGQPIP